MSKTLASVIVTEEFKIALEKCAEREGRTNWEILEQLFKTIASVEAELSNVRRPDESIPDCVSRIVAENNETLAYE